MVSQEEIILCSEWTTVSNALVETNETYTKTLPVDMTIGDLCCFQEKGKE